MVPSCEELTVWVARQNTNNFGAEPSIFQEACSDFPSQKSGGSFNGGRWTVNKCMIDNVVFSSGKCSEQNKAE